MLNKDDKTWMLENFATRGELGLLRTEMQERLESVESKIDTSLTKLDGFAGKIADLDQENKMGAVTLHRHGVNIEELAKATGTTLSR